MTGVQTCALPIFVGDTPNETIVGGSSILFAMGVVAYWLVSAALMPVMSVGMVTGVALAALLLAQAWKWPGRGFGEFAWTFVLAGIVKLSLARGALSLVDLTIYVWTLSSLALWIGGRVMERGAERIASAFGRPCV